MAPTSTFLERVTRPPPLVHPKCPSALLTSTSAHLNPRCSHLKVPPGSFCSAIELQPPSRGAAPRYGRARRIHGPLGAACLGRVGSGLACESEGRDAARRAERPRSLNLCALPAPGP